MKLLRTNLETLAIGVDEKAFKEAAYENMLDWLQAHTPEDLQVTIVDMGTTAPKKNDVTWENAQKAITVGPIDAEIVEEAKDD